MGAAANGASCDRDHTCPEQQETAWLRYGSSSGRRREAAIGADVESEFGREVSTATRRGIAIGEVELVRVIVTGYECVARKQDARRCWRK